MQGQCLLPFDVAVTKGHDSCAKLLRQDELQTTDISQEQMTTTSSETLGHERHIDGDDKTTTVTKDDYQSASDDTIDERNEAAGSLDNDKSTSLFEEQKKNEKGLDDDTRTVVQDDTPTSKDGITNEDSRLATLGTGNRATAVANKRGRRTTGRKQKAADVVAGEDMENNSKGKMERKSLRDSAVAAKKTSESSESRSRSKSQPTTPSQSRDDGGRRHVSAPSRPTSDDASTTAETKQCGITQCRTIQCTMANSNEQRSAWRRKPRQSSPASHHHDTENNQDSSQNLKPKDNRQIGNFAAQRSPCPPQSAMKEPNSIQEQVRIFEMRRLASRELEKTRRYQLNLGRTGGFSSKQTDRQLTHRLKEDFNEKAHRGHRIDSANDLDSLKVHLQGESIKSHKKSEGSATSRI